MRSADPGFAARVLRWTGAADLHHAPELRRELLGALEHGAPVVVDLGAVTRLDTAAAAVLVEGLQRARAKHTTLGLVAVSDASRPILALTRLDVLFGLTP